MLQFSVQRLGTGYIVACSFIDSFIVWLIYEA